MSLVLIVFYITCYNVHNDIMLETLEQRGIIFCKMKFDYILKENVVHIYTHKF